MKRPSIFYRATVDDVYRVARLPMPIERCKKIRCPHPNHEDRHPSASIWPDRRGIKCFTACGRSWGIADLGILLNVGRNAAEVALALEKAGV